MDKIKRDKAHTHKKPILFFTKKHNIVVIFIVKIEHIVIFSISRNPLVRW